VTIRTGEGREALLRFVDFYPQETRSDHNNWRVRWELDTHTFRLQRWDGYRAYRDATDHVPEDGVATMRFQAEEISLADAHATVIDLFAQVIR